MKRKWMYILIAAALAAGALILVKNKMAGIAALPKPEASLPAVRVAAAATGTLEVFAHYQGSIEPLTKSDVSARISGNLLSVAKREGDPVREGEIVAVIDDRELVERSAAVEAEVLATRQRLAGGRSAYETQKSIYERDEKLFAAGAISREALERSRAAIDGAKATVDAYEESIKGLSMNSAAAATQTGYARIRAPFHGVVTRRWMEPGDLAVPGKPILTVEKISPYKVTVQVPQEEMEGLKPGGKAHLGYGDRVTTAAISRVYPALGKNILGSVEMVLPALPFGLPSGSTVGVDLVRKAVTGVIVPENALVRSGAGTFVCVVKDGVVRIRKVNLLGTGEGKAALAGDVAPGEQVAVGQENRLLTLVEGTRVTVAGETK
jgi:RND family efflux transporter MFP subunit